jgi:hypothetical protein
MIGECIDVAIYVEKELYNVHTILYEHTFRELIAVHNRSAVTMKIVVEKPNCKSPRLLPEELQINPSTAYVQGNGEGKVGLG